MFKSVVLASLSYTTFLAAASASAATLTRTSSENSSYAVTGFETPVADGKSSYLLGVYEAATDHTHSHVANVFVDDQGGRPLYLTLTSYEGVDWTFSGNGVGNIAGILLSAYTPGSVVGVDAAKVTSLVGSAKHVGYAYTYPSADATALIDYSTKFFRAPVDAAIMTYSGNGFAIAGSGAVPEPATWALMIGGFGMIGAAMRRRPTAVNARSWRKRRAFLGHR